MPRSEPDALATLHRRMQQYAAASGGVVPARAARELGAGDGDIRALMQLGLWLRVRRGVYADPSHVAQAADGRHLHDAAALVAACGPSTYVAELSAVRLLGLPVPPGVLPDDVAVNRLPGSHGNSPLGARVHKADVDLDDVVLVDGVPVITGATLVLDCAIHLEPPDALAVADAAVRRGLVTLDRLAELRARRSGWPGARRVGAVLDLVDERAENWFESASRWWLITAGLPRPELQHEFQDGSRTARVDFWFEEQRVVGEADGAAKYALSDGHRVLVEEKQREDWLRAEFGVSLVRWMPGDIATAARRRRLIGRLHAALRRSAA